MRPNVDLPWSLHGQVKEFAETYGLSLEEAYQELLQTAVDGELGSRDIDEYSFEEILGDPLESNIPTTKTEYSVDEAIQQVGLHSVVLASPTTGLDENPYVSKARLPTLPLDDFEKALKRVCNASLSRGAGWVDRFAIGQVGGCWFGSGPDELMRALRTRDERTENAEFKTYRTEQITYFARLDDGLHICLSLEGDVGSENVSNGSLYLIFDGVPVSPRMARRVAANFGVQSIPNAQPRTAETVGISEGDELLGDYPIENPEPVVTEDEYEGEWVTGVIADNPFHTHGQLIDQFWEVADEDANIELLRAPKRIYYELYDHYEAGDDVDLDIKTISVTDFTWLVGSESYNIYARVNW